MQAINYLIYISKEAFKFEESILKEILSESRKTNQHLGITGILLYDGGNLMQVLEGPSEQVQALYKKIQADKRHKSVSKIADDFSNERNFQDWAMAFRTATPQLFERVQGYAALSSEILPEERSTNHSVLFLLKTFLAINPAIDDPIFGV